MRKSEASFFHKTLCKINCMLENTDNEVVSALLEMLINYTNSIIMEEE